MYSLQYSPDGTLLAVGYGDSGIQLLSTETGKLDKELRKHKYGALPTMCIRFSPKESHLCFAGTSEGSVLACNVQDTSICEMVHELNNEINCLDFSSDGTVFATAGKGRDVRIYDSVTSANVLTFAGYHVDSNVKDVDGHAKRVFAIKFHPEFNDVLMTGGWDEQVKIWDARCPSGLQRKVSGPFICGDALDIKGDLVLTGSWRAENALQLWDFGSGELIDTIPVLGDDSKINSGEDDAEEGDESGAEGTHDDGAYCREGARLGGIAGTGGTLRAAAAQLPVAR